MLITSRSTPLRHSNNGSTLPLQCTMTCIFLNSLSLRWDSTGQVHTRVDNFKAWLQGLKTVGLLYHSKINTWGTWHYWRTGVHCWHTWVHYYDIQGVHYYTIQGYTTIPYRGTLYYDKQGVHYYDIQGYTIQGTLPYNIQGVQYHDIQTMIYRKSRTQSWTI